MSERTPYTSEKWKAVRLLVLERDGRRCQLRLAKCRGVATAVDHRIDWRDGGALFDPANLVAACSSCNVAKRNRRVAARARAQRNGTTMPEPEATPTRCRYAGVNGHNPNCTATRCTALTW